ncbi:terminase small subunit [Tumebacillus permanentifrigoris]|uniref:Terminase small subunit n=1 Tax=Tumebacillus permanentifrigoris TaxID=378543 RepID=A0A316DRR4_9BACL|nr:terminase small subunit [Tumebacillus permanentifrigoris]PWK07509.1 terminase small subunit [Tumebacillus permanentifrigoris]
MNREEIRKEYETTDIRPKALAEKHGMSVDTLKSWMKRDAQRGDKWTKNEGAPVHTKGAPSSNSKVHPEERGVSPPEAEVVDGAEEPTNPDLTPRQRRFVEEYLIVPNATQAAIRAGYSAKTAKEQGHRLYTNVHIRSAIDAAQTARAQRKKVDADWVLERLIKMADYNTRDFQQLITRKVKVLQPGGNVEEFEVQDVVFNEDFDGTITGGLSKGKDGLKMEMPDRLQTLKLIGQHIGMWKDGGDVNVNIGVQIVDDIGGDSGAD